MIRSMTGFGRSERVTSSHAIIVEVKSVNHRYFEFSSRVPRGYGFLEEKLKSYLQTKISRGKVDVYVSYETLEDGDAQVQVNHDLAASYVEALHEISRRYGVKEDLSATSLSRYPDVLSVHRSPEDEGKVWKLVREVLDNALVSFLAMRETEGHRMKEDVLQRAQTILELVSKIEFRSPQTVEEYKAKLYARLKEMLGDVPIDEQRILTEAAIFADKIAVAEETVRLRSHFAQFGKMLESADPVGRKLDFLVQEMNREANTIGSKATDAEIAYMVVDIKAEIEKIREQIQNIE